MAIDCDHCGQIVSIINEHIIYREMGKLSLCPECYAILSYRYKHVEDTQDRALIPKPSGMTIERLQQEAHRIAVEHGWWENDRNFGEMCALIHSEVSEAFEEWRSGRAFDEVYYKPNSNKLEGISVEFADIIIRIVDFLEKHKINLTDILREKMQFNESRPYRHGGKKA